MIVTCKKCHKRYLIEKEDIGPEGRQVRCVTCGYSWQEHRLEEVLNIGAAVKSTTFDPGYNKGIKPDKKFSWMIWFIVLFFLLCGFYMARDPIATRWPILDKIFTNLKLTLHSQYEGLSIENVSLVQNNNTGDNTFILKGEILNYSQNVKVLPLLEIAAQGECKYAGTLSNFHHVIRLLKSKIFRNPLKYDTLCVLESWNYSLSEKRIFPGEKINFETSAHLTVMGATDVSIEF